MPIYTYGCEKCQAEVEVLLPIGDRDKVRMHCNSPMRRLVGIPFVREKKTGNQMALDALNSKQTSHMKPEMKALAAQGLGR